MAVETLPEWLGQRARVTPRRLALVADGERWTFAELDARVDGVAGELAGLGVAPGTRVGALLDNGAAYVRLVHALIRLGAVLVPLNVRLTEGEIGWQVDDAGLRLLVHDAAHAEVAGRVAAARPALATAPSERWDARGPVGAPASEVGRVYLDATHCIIYTSGTTGQPKGAILTYGNHWWSAVGSALNLGLERADRWLAVLPLFHVGGLAILLRSAIYGIPCLVHARFDPRAVNRAIDEEGVTIVSVVSTMLRRVLEARGDRPFPSSFRCFLLGGGPAPRPLLEACARLGAPVVLSYGLTETASQVATLAPEDALRKLGSSGKPLLPNELRIEDESGVLPAGEIGEIVVRGPSVSPGYLGRSEATGSVIRDGWLHTGDMGYLDDEGYVFVVDRRDDLIVSGGENVYPAEVESVLLGHPSVEDAGVYGVPHAEWGATVVAAIKLRPGASLDVESIRAFCRERLAGYKVPVRVEAVDALPRTASGKLQRRRLRPV